MRIELEVISVDTLLANYCDQLLQDVAEWADTGYLKFTFDACAIGVYANAIADNACGSLSECR